MSCTCPNSDCSIHGQPTPRKTKRLTVKCVHWTLTAEPEDIPIKGNALASGDAVEDKKQERWIERQLANGNQWAWCYVKLRGEFLDLTADDVLGCCSYLSEEDFRTPGGYFDDMVATVLACLQDKYNAIIAFNNGVSD